jgi:hypothetical protein
MAVSEERSGEGSKEARGDEKKRIARKSIPMAEWAQKNGKTKDTALSVSGRDKKLTRRHVESGTATEVRGIVILGRKAKVGELNGHTLVRHQNVLRLQIPVVNPNGMAELYGIQEL